MWVRISKEKMKFFSYPILSINMIILFSAALNLKDIFNLDVWNWFYERIKIPVRQKILPMLCMDAKIKMFEMYGHVLQDCLISSWKLVNLKDLHRWCQSATDLVTGWKSTMDLLTGWKSTTDLVTGWKSTKSTKSRGRLISPKIFLCRKIFS